MGAPVRLSGVPIMLKTSANVPRWSLPAGLNAVYRDWHPHLELPPGLAAVDLGLVDGPVLADSGYITDYSRPSQDRPGARRYSGLADALKPAILAAWRERLVGLLASLLAEGESWYLFLSGKLPADLERPEESFVGVVHADNLRLNGAFTIFEVSADELAYHAALFGNFDGIAGLVAPAGSMRGVLACLTLVDAIPTAQRYRFASPFHVQDTAALARVLAHGRLFVEETDNGTRLRLVTRAAMLAELRARLAVLVADP